MIILAYLLLYQVRGCVGSISTLLPKASADGVRFFLAPLTNQSHIDFLIERTKIKQIHFALLEQGLFTPFKAMK
jgi:hypothetical protein